jgi:thiamine-phosphate pyrophosphorylase
MSANRFPITDLYCLTASEYSRSRTNSDVVRQMLEAGIKIIQYREKDFSMRQKYQECLIIRRLCDQYDACFIVNDDVHLALAAGADGVHVGQDDLPVEKVRQIVGKDMIIGLSTHSPEQADRAASSGMVDYIGVGPLFATSTKKGVCAPVGLDYLDYVVKHHHIPFVAIGGVKWHNIASVVEHGAKCVALVTEIVGAENIGFMIRSLRAEMAKPGPGL